MISSKQVAFSFVAVSGIVILTILRKRSSSLKIKIVLRRIKANCGAEIKEGRDFISQLPDDILFKILVRLSTRDCVRTSILSKRWRNLYTFVPHMEFFCLKTFPYEPLDHFSYHGSGDLMKRFIRNFGCKINCTRGLQEKFINGVDAFLNLHSVSRIITCYLSCCFITSFPDKLEEWICSLGRLGINTLKLNFMCTANNHEMTTFRCALISLVPSLVYLRLTGCFLQPTFKIRPNRLRSLNLDKVTLAPTAISCVLSNCLNLEGLFLWNCTTLFSTLRISGYNLRLKYLIVKFCSNIEEIELWADNLIYFEHFGYKLIEYSFERVPKLKTLSLTLSRQLNDENFATFSCGELAKALPPVSIFYLRIYGQYYEMFTPARSNMFQNVTGLLLGFSMFKPDQLSVALVLEMCPVLCEFHLQIEKLSSAFKGQQVGRSFQFHKQLKIVVFNGFSGTESEMDAARYILRSAMVLEQMIISYCFSHYVGAGEWEKNGVVPLQEERREMIERLLEGCAISKNAQVIVRPIYVSDMKLKSRNN